ncbi:replication initiation protein, partial [Acinetobacter schindleri]
GYLEGEARIEIQFANDVLPFVSELANKFTQIDLQHTVDLSSQYANRLYEILKEVQNYKEQKVFLELDDLRSRFGIENKYKTMSNLKDNVLDLAVT